MHKRSMKEKLLKGGAWALVGRLGAAMSLLGLNAVLARMLSPQDMGMYFLLFSFVSFGAVVAQLGLPKVMVRFIAGALAKEHYDEAVSMVRWGLLGNTLGILLLALFLLSPAGSWIFSFFFHMDEGGSLALWVALWVAGLSLLQLLAEMFRGMHDLKLASVFGGATSGSIALAITLVWWSFYGQASLQEALVLSVCAWFGAVLISLFFIINRLKAFPSGNLEATNLNFQKIKGAAWSLWLSDMLLFILLQADLWVVGAFCSSEDTALYGAAARFMILVALPLMLVNAVVQPMIAGAFAKGEMKKIEPTLRVTATLATVLSLLALLCIFLLGGEMLEFIFGSFYGGAYWLLVILTIGKVFDVASGSCGAVLSMSGRQKELLWITLFSGTLMVVLSIAGAKAFGTYGVAWAAVGGMVLQNILMMIVVYRRFGFWTSFSVKSVLKSGLLTRIKGGS